MSRPASLDAIDTRTALRVYAALACAGGLVLTAWGPVLLASDPSDFAWGTALARMAGAVAIAAGLCALALAAADELARRRGFLWFIAAHAAVWLMLVAQIAGPLGTGWASSAAWALLAVILGLMYIRFSESGGRTWSNPTSVVTPPSAAAAAEAMRSRYEQTIRETAAQEERNRLARDLHDAIKQQIFAIQTNAATAEARFDGDPAGARDAMAQIRQSAREAMTEMEAMLDQLRTVPLENAGLVDAIRRQSEALAFRTGANVDVRVGNLPPSDAFEPGTHQAIFRVAQEALANIGRHARARRVVVAIGSAEGRLDLEIEDDGSGIDLGESATGMGLKNMQARAAEIRGTLHVRRRPEGGTVVALSVPFGTRDAAQPARRRALIVASVFGAMSVVTIANLLRNGFAFGNVFVIFFVLAFGHAAVTYWRLRRAERLPAASGGVRP
jgi:signal transduction histidine kinase